MIAMISELSLQERNDVDLLKRYTDGEQDAFRELVGRYKDSLYFFLRKFLGQGDLVEDVFQETFLQLFVSRDSFDTTRPLRPWLFTIAANKAKDALRKGKRTAAVNLGGMVDSDEVSMDDLLNTIACDNRMPYDDMIRTETASCVEQVIANMPEKLREILLLAYFHRFSYKQIARILSIPMGTVKSRLHAAVKRFAKEWKASSTCQMAYEFKR
jgi:RNA polymerase sigma-70 factor (ECF subfamily)